MGDNDLICFYYVICVLVMYASLWCFSSPKFSYSMTCLEHHTFPFLLLMLNKNRESTAQGMAWGWKRYPSRGLESCWCRDPEYLSIANGQACCLLGNFNSCRNNYQVYTCYFHYLVLICFYNQHMLFITFSSYKNGMLGISVWKCNSAEILLWDI